MNEFSVHEEVEHMMISRPEAVRNNRRTLIFFVLLLMILPLTEVQSSDLTLDEAIDLAINRSARGGIIRGKEEVAEQSYFARRINFMLPEISIQGNVPAYASDESYRFFGADPDKSLYKTRDLDFNSFIELKQNVPVTGGSITATANLTRLDNRYPDTRFESTTGYFVDEMSNRGFFGFTLDQQLFRPSSSKNELNNTKDDLEIARMTRHEEQAALKKEVIESFMGTLQLEVKLDLYGDKLESARVKSNVDSVKLADGIISDEDFLLSVSARLDAELESFEIETQAVEQRRELAILLDVNVTEELNPTEPTGSFIDEETQQRLVASWEYSVPIRKAERQFSKAERSAEYAASGHGLIGDLQASYSFGRQKVERERYDATLDETVRVDDDINTAGWGIKLQFKIPLWDGGAGSAAVKAARFEAEQARLTYSREQKKARAEIINLVNQLDVSHRRLEIIKKQIELAANKLEIARARKADGQISQLTFLESRIFYLETRNKYLEELKQNLLDTVELESKFIS